MGEGDQHLALCQAALDLLFEADLQFLNLRGQGGALQAQSGGQSRTPDHDQNPHSNPQRQGGQQSRDPP